MQVQRLQDVQVRVCRCVCAGARAWEDVCEGRVQVRVQMRV